eukprot:5777951-Prorocentrum_lima.AAC.1
MHDGDHINPTDNHTEQMQPSTKLTARPSPPSGHKRKQLQKEQLLGDPPSPSSDGQVPRSASLCRPLPRRCYTTA